MQSRVIYDQRTLNEVAELLRINGLPYQDLQLENNVLISYHDESGEMIGSGGLEFYADYALMRSVAVDAAHRGKSIGKGIVDDLLERAKQKSVREIYLLTETAHDFFTKKGFRDITRENVPEAVRASSEFKSVCPISAACMVYHVA